MNDFESLFKSFPDQNGYFDIFGGSFVPETLTLALDDLKKEYEKSKTDSDFQKELRSLLKTFCGRKTPLYFAKSWTEKLGGAKIYLKREDLLHTGAHKINNALGQILLAKKLGKTRIIAETGAGQHGVATASVAAKFGMKCTIYMGEIDMKRQSLNVLRMNLMGAEVISVKAGQKTLKEAVNEALRDWVTNINNTHYVLGSALGPHPYPSMVRDFHRVIGEETKEQILKYENKFPDLLIACVGGGSNAMGFFYDFLDHKAIKMVGVEAGGKGIKLGQHAARFQGGRVGVLQGTKTWLLSDEEGQIQLTHSISAGLDYPAVGPEHAFLNKFKRINYTYAKDDEVIDAFKSLSRTEGILPALESSHALAYANKIAPKMNKDKIIIVNLSGRGDKDLDQVNKYINESN